MRFINLTRQTEIGANSYFLELGGKKLVLDAGLHPKQEGEAALPNYKLVTDGSLDAILISHAHQDHIGSLPVLMRRQPQAGVFMTGPTAKLSDVMLHNSVNVMLRQREELGLSGYPLFTHREADHAVQAWQSVGFRQHWTVEGERIPGPDKGLTFEMYQSGHILGAAGILIRGEGKTVFYTGDVNFLEQTLMRGADFPETEIDVLIIETTRGDRALDKGYTRKSEEERFLAALEAAFDRGGSILIPVFALGKTQEVLAMLHLFKRRGDLQRVPIYIGGLSTKITTVHDQLASESARQYEGLQLLDSVGPRVLNGREIAATQIGRRKIFALSSGMMTEKTLSNLLAERFLSDPRHSVFFVGYADPDSPAGRLKVAQQGELIQLDRAAPSHELVCHVSEFDFSAHAPRDLLFDYIRKISPKTVVLVHGDPPAVSWFETKISAELPGVKTVVPQPGQEYEF
ncbi:MAG TPA: MBL fold metallo-hydrolase [Chthoniobacterales bacterium]|nr:MBL fold metallo-hydrolase [Chthoniobacterales bacterium]